jgi:predicted dehydrogenase
VQDFPESVTKYMESSNIKIGVIGYGYWGPNIVRNFISTTGAKVTTVCDMKPKNLMRANKLYPDIKCTLSSDEILLSPDIDAVAIITPVCTHYELIKKALYNGKHVFVEKPFTATVAEAEELIETAQRMKLTIMVDHTFIFTGAVKKIKEVINDNSLGELCYYDSTRVNLGIFQQDVNVIWDLAPHDFAIMDYVLQKEPVAISATGMDHFNSGHENIAYLTVFFDDKFIAHFSVNWLSPVKIRTTLIGGQKKCWCGMICNLMKK